jgi:hypothetical protein
VICLAYFLLCSVLISLFFFFLTFLSFFDLFSLSRYIIHTVGPRYNEKYKTAAENALHSCYKSSLTLLKVGFDSLLSFSLFLYLFIYSVFLSFFFI